MSLKPLGDDRRWYLVADRGEKCTSQVVEETSPEAAVELYLKMADCTPRYCDVFEVEVVNARCFRVCIETTLVEKKF